MQDINALRHTAAHILAQAVKRLHPDATLGIGPSIDDGFYYDFGVKTPFTPDDLKKIEREMKKIVRKNLPILHEVADAAAAQTRLAGEPFKLELLAELSDAGEAPSFYTQGEFCDLCAGPHMEKTGDVRAFKLTSTAGAYWRGSEKNPMLCRIYGTAFFTQDELDAHLARIEEAKKRDHRKLGREMELFMFNEAGAGFPFFLPRGVILKNLLIEYWRRVHKKYGYEEIQTPMILSGELWHKSGHYDNYRENMYGVTIDERDFFIKPMNCPGGMLVYQNRQHSYREFPLRYSELGVVHRHELSGTLHGLVRVRAFTQDDAHIYMMPEQLTDEAIASIRLFEEVYAAFGMTDFTFELSTRPENSIGTAEEWEVATKYLEDALEKTGHPYKINPGDGAFYGPKIDFHLKDSLGRSFQCGTIQCDMQMPERFDLTYINAAGQKARPAMIHRTCLGSIERFIAILTEHCAGWFPVWLAPVQAIVLPIADRHHDYANRVCATLEDAGVRVQGDLRAEKIGYKIREAQLMRMPYMLVVGDKECEDATVAVRTRDGDEGAIPLAGLAGRILGDGMPG